VCTHITGSGISQDCHHTHSSRESGILIVSTVLAVSNEYLYLLGAPKLETSALAAAGTVMDLTWTHDGRCTLADTLVKDNMQQAALGANRGGVVE
jgi:hypothetical protein